MASPPFNVAETVPGDSDIVSQFPAAERTFRDIMEDWMNTEHNTYGHHKIPSLSTTNRDADTDWSIGGLIYNTTTKQLQYTLSIDPDVWYSEGVPTATRCVFQQTAAPTGYTKESGASYNEAVMCGTTGSVGTAGSVSSETLFARTGTDAVTLVAGNIPSLTSGNFGFTSSLPNHTHSAGTYAVGTSITNGTGVVNDVEPDITQAGGGGGSGGPGLAQDVDTTKVNLSLASGTVSGVSGNPSSNPSITATITYTNGSQTTFTPAIDCRVKRFSVIVATKD